MVENCQIIERKREAEKQRGEKKNGEAKPKITLCPETELDKVMLCINDDRTEAQIDECLKHHKGLFSRGSGRIATSGRIKGENDVSPGRRRHSHGGNRPR